MAETGPQNRGAPVPSKKGVGLGGTSVAHMETALDTTAGSTANEVAVWVTVEVAVWVTVVVAVWVTVAVAVWVTVLVTVAVTGLLGSGAISQSNMLVHFPSTFLH
jgi:hypothetical protein